jgi:ligand-binding sensor domain-containing protein
MRWICSKPKLPTSRETTSALYVAALSKTVARRRVFRYPQANGSWPNRLRLAAAWKRPGRSRRKSLTGRSRLNPHVLLAYKDQCTQLFRRRTD